MIELELEKTYLAKFLPTGLKDCPNKEIEDIYIPDNIDHPSLRLRKRGDKYEITKKQPVTEGDSSEQHEHTIVLTKEEFSALEQVRGKAVRKIRYYYKYEDLQAEVDVFQDDLAGLVLIDFEFKEVAQKNNFTMPEFCLTDVTQDHHFAGGMLCGKKYSEIESHLENLGYVKMIDNS